MPPPRIDLAASCNRRSWLAGRLIVNRINRSSNIVDRFVLITCVVTFQPVIAWWRKINRSNHQAMFLDRAKNRQINKTKKFSFKVLQKKKEKNKEIRRFSVGCVKNIRRERLWKPAVEGKFEVGECLKKHEATRFVITNASHRLEKFVFLCAGASSR